MMIYDDSITERDWYMYRRGELKEYIRHHETLPVEVHRQLYQWVTDGHSVHDNPWGIKNSITNLPCDYLTAMDIYYSK